jgi:hypothetical protein
LGRLIKQTPLTFKRYGESDTDDNGYTIDAVDELLEVKGSLQPAGSGDVQRIKASGVDARSVYKYYTTTLLRNTNEEDRTVADTTTIDGRKYEVFDTGDWSKTVLRNVAHYKTLLVRVSKKHGN